MATPVRRCRLRAIQVSSPEVVEPDSSSCCAALNGPRPFPGGFMATTLERLERALSALLALATIAAVVILLERRFDSKTASQEGARVEAVDDWRSVEADVIVPVEKKRHGVPIAVFTDYECPICKTVDEQLRRLQEERGVPLVKSIIHFPLPGHRQAMPAARALECAASAGRASEMHRALYRNADSLGIRPWTELARVAGVSDTAGFSRCVRNTLPNARIQAGVDLGMRLRVSGTPAYIIDGVLYDAARYPDIERAIVAVASKYHEPL